MENAQINIKLVVSEDTSMGGPKRSTRTQSGTVAAQRATRAGAFKPAKTDPGTYEFRLAKRLREEREDAAKRVGHFIALQRGPTGPVGQVFGGVSRAAQWFTGQAGGEEAAAGTKAAFGSIAAAGAVVAGGAKFIESILPLILASVNTIVRKEIFGEAASDMISEKISEVFTSMTAALPALGQTKDVLTGQIRLGGKPGFDYAQSLYGQFYYVEQQRQQLGASMSREINKDFVKQLTNLAMGR